MVMVSSSSHLKKDIAAVDGYVSTILWPQQLLREHLAALQWLVQSRLRAGVVQEEDARGQGCEEDQGAGVVQEDDSGVNAVYTRLKNQEDFPPWWRSQASPSWVSRVGLGQFQFLGITFF